VAANPHGGQAAARAKQLLAALANRPDGDKIEVEKLPEPVEEPEVASSAG
jgi:hypothetical protein